MQNNKMTKRRRVVFFSPPTLLAVHTEFAKNVVYAVQLKQNLHCAANDT